MKPSLSVRTLLQPLAFCLGILLAALTATAQVPGLLNYQGRVLTDGVPFNGSGQFKFALVNGDGSVTYWSNDGSSTAGAQPATAASLAVVQGNYSVLLGDTTLAHMTTVPATVFANGDVRLRVWFNDGTHGFELLAPDQRIAAVGYALASNVPDGSVTAAKLAPALNASLAKLNSSPTFSGTVTADGFSGSGAGLTQLNAAQLTGSLDASRLGGTLDDARLSPNVPRLSSAGSTFAGIVYAQAFQGDGAGLTNLNAGALQGVVDDTHLSATVAKLNSSPTFTGIVTAPNFVGGVSITTPRLGTVDSTPLELVVNGSRALRIEPGSFGYPNWIAGPTDNLVSAGKYGAVISGGVDNAVTENFGTISGGQQNRIEADGGVIGGGGINKVEAGAVGAVIGGGFFNEVRTNAQYATVVGGFRNHIGINATNAFVGGGYQNVNYSHLAGTIAGGEGNQMGADATHATIAGGSGNLINGSAIHATIAGGRGNRVTAEGAAISGGFQNFIFDSYSTIGGGDANIVWSAHGTIAGGEYNSITNAPEATIGGGAGNRIADGWHVTIGGGTGNHATSDRATVAGGGGNAANGEGATIGGGGGNRIADGADVTIGGGLNNTARGNRATVAGGGGNEVNGEGATIAGGRGNKAYGEEATVGGGLENMATDSFATVAGGRLNVAQGLFAAVGGGTNCAATADGATVGGGYNNLATNKWATVSGGQGNLAIGDYATVPGGQDNKATNRSFAAGTHAKAIHTGSFVWGDSTEADVNSGGINEFVVRASGGFRFYSSADRSSGVILAEGGGSWLTISDRNTKENVKPADGREMLEKVTSLPLATWNYKTQPESIRHIGPMAQDFKAAFGLGESETAIATVDADGVALAAIQGLNQKLEAEVKSKDQRIQELETRLAELEKLVRRAMGSMNSTEGSTKP